MSCDEARTTPWRVHVSPPRPTKGEANIYLRATRRRDGRAEEQRCSSGTLDPAHAELERARFEADLNAGTRTVPAIMDARIGALEAEVRQGTKSQESVDGFRTARDRMAETLDVTEPTRAAILRARDQLGERGVGSETINTYLRRAAACWRWAEERGMVAVSWPRLKALPKPPRSKRPYSPAEVEAVLAWVAAWQGGRWHALLSLVADTGRRVGEVCKLQGRDVDRSEATVRIAQKGQRVLVLPVSPEVLALLPRRKPGEWMFPRPRRGGGAGPAHRNAVRQVVRRAVAALKIPDGERLDTHSLRRSFAADAHRAGVPDDVTRRLTGHETRAMLGHYQRDAVGDDLRAAQAEVRAYRAARAAPPENPPNPPGSERRKSWGYEESNLRPRPYQGPPAPDLTASEARTSGSTAPGGPGHAVPVDAPVLPVIGQDAELALVARWWAECPSAMRRYTRSLELQAQFIAADEAQHPKAERTERSKRHGS